MTKTQTSAHLFIFCDVRVFYLLPLLRPSKEENLISTHGGIHHFTTVLSLGSPLPSLWMQLTLLSWQLSRSRIRWDRG